MILDLEIDKAAELLGCHSKTLCHAVKRPYTNAGLSRPISLKKLTQVFGLKAQKLDEFLTGADRCITSTEAAECFGLHQIEFFSARRGKPSPIPAPVINRPNFLRWSRNEVQWAAIEWRNRRPLSGCATPGTPDSFELGPQGWAEV